MSDILEQMANRTFEQYTLELTYIMPDGSTKMGISPLLHTADNYPILLVSDTGKIVIADNKFDINKNPEFAWAKETLSRVRSDLKKLDSLGVKEGLAWRTFQQQGGWLGICENGAAVTVHDALCEEKNIRKASQYTLGSSLNAAPIIGINAGSSGGKNEILETLLHEMTHNLHDTVHPFQDTKAFLTALELERALNKPIVRKLDRQMNSLIRQGAYSERQINKELLCRLHEEKIRDAENFARELPALNDFYEKMMYPTVLYHLDGNMASKDIMIKGMDMELPAISPLHNLYENLISAKNGETKHRLAEELETKSSYFTRYVGYICEQANDTDKRRGQTLSDTLKKLQTQSEQKRPRLPDHVHSAWRKGGNIVHGTKTMYDTILNARFINRRKNDSNR